MRRFVEYGVRVSPTLGQLVADPRLGLRVLAGSGSLHHPVSWVHVSELDDPTPFLDGGELLLTTGLRIGPATDLPAVVTRLAARGVAGLGFGTGLSHDRVPSALVTAAAAADLPLLEVPHSTPFIAISKTVSAALAAQAYAEVTTTNAAQQALTRAALGTRGAAGVVGKLSQLLDGWVVLLDPAGEVRHAAPASAVRRIGPLADEIDRLRERGRLASASFALGAEHVVLQVLGTPRRGFLAIGRRAPLDRTQRQVLAAAASVLTLTLVRATALDRAHRRLRTGLLRLMLAEQAPLAADVAADASAGPLPVAPVTVCVLAGPTRALEGALDLLDRDAGHHRSFAAEWDGRLVVLAEGERRLAGIPTGVAGLAAGVSEPVAYGRLADGLRQAWQAADAAQRRQLPLLRFVDLGGVGLSRLLPGDEARAYGESLLAPLLRHDERRPGDLVVTLTEWLRHHGEWDPTAARLGVHRHTVRNRIRKAAELIGCDLDSAGTRAELWFALHLLGDGRVGPDA